MINNVKKSDKIKDSNKLVRSNSFGLKKLGENINIMEANKLVENIANQISSDKSKQTGEKI